MASQFDSEHPTLEPRGQGEGGGGGASLSDSPSSVALRHAWLPKMAEPGPEISTSAEAAGRKFLAMVTHNNISNGKRFHPRGQNTFQSCALSVQTLALRRGCVWLLCWFCHYGSPR